MCPGLMTHRWSEYCFVPIHVNSSVNRFLWRSFSYCMKNLSVDHLHAFSQTISLSSAHPLCDPSLKAPVGLLPADAPKKISGADKSCWRYILEKRLKPFQSQKR